MAGKQRPPQHAAAHWAWGGSNEDSEIHAASSVYYVFLLLNKRAHGLWFSTSPDTVYSSSPSKQPMRLHAMYPDGMKGAGSVRALPGHDRHDVRRHDQAASGLSGAPESVASTQSKRPLQTGALR